MLTRTSESADGRRLAKLFQGLSATDRQTLLAFADFLAQRAQPERLGEEKEPREPRALPRPDTESVVGAIKRLSHTYDMLDRGPLLNETSALMSAHVLQGRGAMQVIDELEALFARHYQDYRAKYDANDEPSSV
ncbi:hypothetical protein [Thiocystis violascens]|uniref:Crp/Fnr family transcriptional regulator n=1 Tax=Thiocystis violascens (strain ATCC 17096 / DSM 198 / 6111) TaxID=765911 RepID=I3YAT6_THIV6|nr:hypothetical protein [Thiocystis violascens]AFL74104.1 hypothetical protein Thivi_2154 [Thiocystis violascens DSM 198]